MNPIVWIDGEYIFPKEDNPSWPDYMCYEEREDDYYEQGCKHGYIGKCDACDAEDYELETRMGGIDKCLNCGSYKWGKELNSDQCCIKGCVNPNEY